MNPSIRWIVVLVLLLLATPALADNCGSLGDCYGTVQSAAAVVAGIAAGVGLPLILRPLSPSLDTQTPSYDSNPSGLGEGHFDGPLGGPDAQLTRPGYGTYTEKDVEEFIRKLESLPDGSIRRVPFGPVRGDEMPHTMENESGVEISEAQGDAQSRAEPPLIP